MNILKELAELEFHKWFNVYKNRVGANEIFSNEVSASMAWDNAIEFVNRELVKMKCENCCHLVENNLCNDPQNIKFVCLNFKQSDLADGREK